MFPFKRRMRAIAIPSIIIGGSLTYFRTQCNEAKKFESPKTDVITRLESFINFEDLEYVRTTNCVKLFRSGAIRSIDKPHRFISNVAVVDIDGDGDLVVSVLLDRVGRDVWGSSARNFAIKLKDKSDKSKRLTHFAQDGKDYVTEVHRIGGENSQAIINIDASSLVGSSLLYIRGKQNSIILLEPVPGNINLNRVTFCIERDTTFRSTSNSEEVPLTFLLDLRANVKKCRIALAQDILDDLVIETQELENKIKGSTYSLAHYTAKQGSGNTDLSEKIQNTKMEMKNLEEKLNIALDNFHVKFAQYNKIIAGAPRNWPGTFRNIIGYSPSRTWCEYFDIPIEKQIKGANFAVAVGKIFITPKLTDVFKTGCAFFFDLDSFDNLKNDHLKTISTKTDPNSGDLEMKINSAPAAEIDDRLEMRNLHLKNRFYIIEAKRKLKLGL